MKDTLEIGPVPSHESCQQVGTDNYDSDAARAECNRFRDLIREHCGNEPDGAILSIKSNPHDFGNYLEVVVRFDDGNEIAANYAYHIESHAPTSWDGDGAKRWIALMEA